jgi:hypothetical protein
LDYIIRGEGKLPRLAFHDFENDTFGDSGFDQLQNRVVVEHLSGKHSTCTNQTGHQTNDSG